MAVRFTGWWSDVLADAIKRSGKLRIAACYSRWEEKRQAFAGKSAPNSAAGRFAKEDGELAILMQQLGLKKQP